MYDGRNGFGYQPSKADDSASPVDVFTGQRLFKPPLAYKIIDTSKWKESDKVWATHYMGLWEAYNREVENRITYQEMCNRLEEENKFLISLVNSEE